MRSRAGWTGNAPDLAMDGYRVANLGELGPVGIMASPLPDVPPLPPLDVPGVGRMAVLQDPQGADIIRAP